MAIATCPEQLAKARMELHDEMHAQTTRVNKSTKLALAEDLAKETGNDPVYPLTYKTIEDVAACLKGADYSSGYSYLQELRGRHEDLGYEVQPWMKRLMSRCQASIEKGLGGQTKARTMDLKAIAARIMEGDDQGHRGQCSPYGGCCAKSS